MEKQNEDKDNHNCKEYMEYNGKQEFDSGEVFFWGKCALCDRELVETFSYVDTRDKDTDEIVK